METQTQDIGPWYKQTWLWFVLTPLIAVFIYGTFFLYIAITTSDGIVRDDYYKVARGMNVDTTRTQRAVDLGLQGEIFIDTLTGDIRVELLSSSTLPPQLSLDLVHPTHQKYDQSIRLRQVNPGSGIYLGSLSQHIEGKRYLLLSDESAEWLIREEIIPPYDQNRFILDARD